VLFDHLLHKVRHIGTWSNILQYINNWWFNRFRTELELPNSSCRIVLSHLVWCAAASDQHMKRRWGRIQAVNQLFVVDVIQDTDAIKEKLFRIHEEMLLEQLHKYQSNLQINSDRILRLDKPEKHGWNKCITAYQMPPFLSFYCREKTFDLFYVGRVDFIRLSRHGALKDNRRFWTLSRRSYRVVKLRIAALHIVRCGIRENFFEQDLFSASFSHRAKVVATRCELTFLPCLKNEVISLIEEPTALLIHLLPQSLF